MGIVKYVKEAYNELVHKVTWPSTTQLSNSAVIVMITSAVFACVILVMDLAFENLFKAIYTMLY